MSARRCGPALLLFALCGCAGPGFELVDLAEQPIAIVHRSREDSDRRAELLERGGAPAQVRPGDARVRLEDVAEILGIGPNAQDRLLAALGHLALLHPRTGSVERVEEALAGARPLCWSADRGRLLFSSARGRAELQIFEYDRTRREVRAVTRGPDAHPYACYGPGGRLVLVAARRTPAGSTARLLVTGPGGVAPQPLTDGPADLDPVWSPVGDPIAFVTRGPDGGPAIATVSPDASSPRRVIARGKDPAFTPDGAWIVYSARSRGRWRLWRVRPDGSGKALVGTSQYDELDPSVAPDGRFLVFVAEEPGSVRQRLFVRRLDGSSEPRTLLEREEGSHPTW